MSFVATPNKCCNNFNYQGGMYMGPYLPQEMPASAMNPRIKPYSGISSYKNVKSGQYNRQLCWPCADFKGFPQAPGVYNLNIVDTPPPMPDYNAMKLADFNYQIYQNRRMQNSSIIYNKKGENVYSNYLDTCCGNLYPNQYVKGNWPDEKLIYTNAPANGCHTVKSND
jgi:hypothetical protein